MTRPVKASLLLFFFLVCGSAFVLSYQMRVRVPPPAPHELFAIVNQQLASFRAADFQSAYQRAATGVQQKFTLAQFETMVRRGYPEMTRARRVEFGSVRVQGVGAVVQVFFFGSDGLVREFLYSLTREGDAWRIEGVEELNSYRAHERLAGTHV